MKENTTVVSLLIGITKKATWIFLCQNVFLNCYKKLQHPKPTKPQFAPHLWVVPAYGQTIQMAPVDESKKLDTKGIRRA